MRFSVAVLSLALGAVATPARADSWDIQRSVAALPGMHRVATVEPFPEDLTLFAGAGYGVAGSVIDPDDSHQRTTGSLAASYGFFPWLAVAARLDGRYDRHQDSLNMAEGDVDGGLVGDPRFALRGRTEIAEGMHLGLQLGLWLPGQDAPSLVLSAATVDVVTAFSYAPPGRPFRVGVNAGFRLDNSAESADGAFMLSQPDRLSLGVSDSNAILLGVGAGYRLGRAELFGEWTWDLLVGDEAPSARTSPMRFATGARIAITSTLTAQLLLEANAANHPETDPNAPLAPFEPRFSVNTGLFYRFGASRAEPETLLGDALPEPEPEPAPALVSLNGKVVDDTGAPVEGAEIIVVPTDPGETAEPASEPDSTSALAPDSEVTPDVAADADAAPEPEPAPVVDPRSRRAVSDAEGLFVVAGLIAGPIEVTVTKDGFDSRTKTIALAPTGINRLSITLDPELPAGQIRGYIRSYSGKGISATLRVEPLGLEITAEADGSFQLDVPPGEYEVVVTAPRYRKQRRPVEVERGGVTIVNVDLRRKKRR